MKKDLEAIRAELASALKELDTAISVQPPVSKSYGDRRLSFASSAHLKVSRVDKMLNDFFDRSDAGLFKTEAVS